MKNQLIQQQDLHHLQRLKCLKKIPLHFQIYLYQIIISLFFKKKIISNLILILSFSNLLKASFQPQKRHYDTHIYYVMETKSSNLTHSQASFFAQSLNAQLVERVGELKDSWLINAHKDFVNQGYQLYLPSSNLGHQPLNSRNLIQRDSIIERFELIKRSINNPQLQSEILEFDHHQAFKSKRSLNLLPPNQISFSIKSLDRQILRQRHKRNVIYVPSKDGSQPQPLDHSSSNLHTRNPTSLSLSQLAAKKFNIRDPLWPKQWHLVNDAIPHLMINVTGVWDMGITGKNISVAIVDDGIDMTSEDLKPNFFEAGSWDYNDHTPLPEPRLPDDLHGTRCAGEIAAIRNDVCGVGVAYDAKVAGIRILSATISDADEASALNYAYHENHVYSCSWGPPDDGRSMEAPSRLIFKAMLNGIQNGRDGKGSIFVFASGNGGAVDDQCNFDGYTNSIYSITISAIDRKALHPYYSEVCSANMVVTFSSGSGDNIHTTDVGKKKCTDRHGGTSAAAPLGAAIFALVLQARPELTWRDVQYLAVTTATPFSLDEDDEWQKTAAGRWYNHKFGFGNLDAYKIVQAAKTWKLVKPQAWWTSPNVNAHSQPVTKEGANSTMVVKQSDIDGANLENLEHITVAVNINHNRRGNVRVELTSPHGSVSILATHRRFDDATTGFPGWVFMSVKHWGENPVGNWTLTVKDPHQAPDTNGTFEDWAIGMWGECKDPLIQKLFKMPDDAEIILPPSPLPGVALETVMPGWKPPETAASPAPTGNPPPLVSEIDMDYKTKSLARPTDHLPADHAGNYSSPDVLTGLGGLSSYLRGKSSWVFVAFGTVVVLGGCLFGWLFILRGRRRREQEGLHSRFNDQNSQTVGLLSGSTRNGMIQKMFNIARGKRNGYGFEPVAGEDDLPMRSMNQSGSFANRLRGSSGQKLRKATTKELYDAFGEGDSDSEEDQDEVDHQDRRVFKDIEADDEYMDSFLEDDSEVQTDSKSQAEQRQEESE
ncbi:hypothetical protein O181_015538 [Austropuccinia psidii MF-1]|uniref:P/Homo B domain-containing protein n=1 Tax=Austropuccinia psidii MF-1 TaxID=1389203 RepID=A0A9Q3GQ24_9BASI|nr:hypothetical protein [Austropuccinia psidii MF-1]